MMDKRLIKRKKKKVSYNLPKRKKYIKVKNHKLNKMKKTLISILAAGSFFFPGQASSESITETIFNYMNKNVEMCNVADDKTYCASRFKSKNDKGKDLTFILMSRKYKDSKLDELYFIEVSPSPVIMFTVNGVVPIPQIDFMGNVRGEEFDDEIDYYKQFFSIKQYQSFISNLEYSHLEKLLDPEQDKSYAQRLYDFNVSNLLLELRRYAKEKSI